MKKGKKKEKKMKEKEKKKIRKMYIGGIIAVCWKMQVQASQSDTGVQEEEEIPRQFPCPCS